MNKNFGIVIYDVVQPMDVIGPWEVIATWKKLLDAPIDMFLVSEDGGDVRCDNQIVLNAHRSFESCPKLDYLLLPGGRGRREQVNNQRLIDFIRQQATTCDYLLSVCTGMFLLYQTGLLKGKEVTTYWRAIPELKAFDDITVVGERVVKSGNIWASGGISSGIDLALELIAEIAGKEIAGEVQLLFEYFPEDAGLCTAHSKDALPPYVSGENPSEVELPAYIKRHIKS